MSNLLLENNRNAQRTTWDKKEIKSFFGAEAVKAKFNKDPSNYVHGTGGAGNHNISTDKSGEITINAHQCDLLELQFMESYDPRNPLMSQRTFDFTHKDLRTGRTIVGRKCKIKTMPEYSFSEDSTARVFVLNCHELIIIPGVA